MEFKILLTSAAFVALSALGASAQENATLAVEGETILTSATAPAFAENLDKVYSGWLFRKLETRALQMDDFDNPAFVFVDQGIDLFEKVDGTEGKACASCHEDVEDFAGLRPSMPRVEDGTLVTMENLVNDCRTERMGAEPWKYTGGQMTAVTALIGLQSRGMTVDVAVDGDAAPFFERGKELYYQRVGQLDMSCSNCHEDNYGTMIRADHLSQGQINGFPTYRLKNAKLNSAHARFKGCMKNIRATPFKVGGDEFKALELYLASRGNGLSVETPSVRN
ncbi:MAG: sulfur oxidation c-type cytochrome SoxA [Planktomarina sp.]|jgi:sulfur-oxidizing protein SoxA|nr:sulfur oxidation c-type cytochrome SoxA [Planktomarina sp.]MDT2056529.1 sulfur oxidation c-type cytochrome SoxA [Planktomarina sp.]MDT2074054.1 sulfur oxidation c-type cytochrome SoxA [Planktomarina sp.]MDT2078764.1 sulfur oxidation c-type cytochrome SoxA [Planktomarina sp.]HAJ84560.1 sulfur oxidation c-type cytochrome SoxA [Paracoccaceae bacterium]|tara:strand:+ start:372 stop:1208 length:837 start_codon:yes stop_codon:yes gene_type:complete